MKLPFITSLLERRARRRLRRMMRGYRILRASGRLSRIPALHSALTVMPLAMSPGGFSARFLGAAVENAELSVRQYLLSLVGGTKLTKAVLSAVGDQGSKVVHPLPAEWRRVVREHGFDVAMLGSSVLWAGWVVLVFSYGVVCATRAVLGNLRASRAERPETRRYAHFEGLAPGNLPRPCNDGRSHEIVTWYLQWNGRPAGLDAVTHTVQGQAATTTCGTPVLPVSSPYPPLRLDSSMRLLAWTITAVARGLFDLARGRWWHAILLKEAVRAAEVRFQAPARLATDYLFHNSSWIYRPLWTYEAERAGSRTLLYFYSTNTEAFKNADGYPDIIYGYRSMTWTHYLAWDDYQASFIRRCVGERARVSVVGSIWFSSSPAELKELGACAVAVFDVQPHRESRYRMLGLATEYYVPRVARQFLLDVHEALQECGSEMVLKRKREIGRMLHPRYRSVVEQLSRSSGFTAVDPEISALRVIDASAAVISMPFTSTALLGRDLGKPSVFYDPFGMVEKDDRAAHGIEVLCGHNELRSWLFRVFGPVKAAHADAAASSLV